MKPRSVQYILTLSGWLVASLFLGFKCFLYDNQEYEADLFSILQLTKDYLLGKPLLFENAYGDNSALHNYYLLPLVAPFTLLFGGKGLFVAAYVLWIWAWNLWAKLLKGYPLTTGLGFLLIVFGPTAFYQWDNPHFGWHAENFYFPLLLLLSAALLLQNRLISVLAALLIILNREDGIILAAGVFVVYRWSDQSPFSDNIRRTLKTGLAAAAVFIGGMLLLYFRSGGQSRLGEAAERFGQAYTPLVLFSYLDAEYWLWFLLAGVLLIPIFLLLNRKDRLLPIVALVVAVQGINFMAAAYYFPDSKYGINWAPRLSGTYGLLCGLLGMVFYRSRNLWGRKLGMMPAAGMAIFLIQAFAPIGPDYDPYSFSGRFNLIVQPDKRKLQNPAEREKLQQWFDATSRNEPVRTEEILFSIADHADLVWPDTLRIPFREPETAVLYRHRAVNQAKWNVADSTEQFFKYVRSK